MTDWALCSREMLKDFKQLTPGYFWHLHGVQKQPVSSAQAPYR